MVQYYNESVDLRIASMRNMLSKLEVQATGVVNDLVFESAATNKVLSFEDFKKRMNVEINHIVEEFELIVKEQSEKNEKSLEKAFVGRKERRQKLASTGTADTYITQLNSLVSNYLNCWYDRYHRILRGLNDGVHRFNESRTV